MTRFVIPGGGMNIAGLLRAGAVVVAIVLGGGVVRAALVPSVPAVPTAMIQGAPSAQTPGNAEPEAIDMDRASTDDVTSELQIMVARASLTTGDAPGTDSTWAPRPAQSTRLLDAPLTKNGSRIRVYSTTRELDDVMGEVDRGLRNSGFSRQDSSADPHTSTYHQGLRYIVARFSLNEDRVLVSLMEVELRTAED